MRALLALLLLGCSSSSGDTHQAHELGWLCYCDGTHATTKCGATNPTDHECTCKPNGPCLDHAITVWAPSPPPSHEPQQDSDGGSNEESKH